jgi:hypothetical protein
MVEVGRHGAFSVNGIGLNGAPFPLSFSARKAGGSWLVDAAAAQAGELADVLAGAAGDTIVVVDLATSSFLDDDYVQWPPSRIAAAQGVRCQAHPLGALASGVIGLSAEAIAIRSEDLPRFLDGRTPYALTLADMQGSPDPARTEEIALAIGTTARGKPVLPALPGSRLRYSGHDDCYLHIESADPALPAALLSRLLALLAGSALAGTCPVNVPEPPAAIAASLIAGHPHWTGWLSASQDTVAISLTALAEPCGSATRSPSEPIAPSPTTRSRKRGSLPGRYVVSSMSSALPSASECPR